MPRHNIKAAIFSQNWKIVQLGCRMLIQFIWFIKNVRVLLLILMAIEEVWWEDMQVQGEHL